MSVDPNKVKSVFLKAVEVCEPGNWTEFLEEACEGDNELRRRVEVLLGAHIGEDSLFDDQVGPSPTLDQPITEKPGTQIGPYKLLQQVGEGGMGVVYMAEQKEPVKRRVALKIIKPGMDTRQVIARFEAERQALAMMDHPNIAKVLDAGQTESGRPYFVMELVKGMPVTKYCDEQHLTPKERLELFVPICQAVQHAHQKGIIHRDLKPSNILVALYDGHPVPKIIDFGVAKATSQTLTEKTMFTQVGQVVGTLEYMAPEQAQVNQLDVDTRSDVYSLGVVLYELLTGETPFDRQRLRSAAFDEMLRIIREEEPSKPSTKVSSSQSLPSIAANRRIEPAKLGSMIRGELDWIVLKAMEKDRGRRYETASKFAEDVQHYLNDEAVVACPPSRAYRLRKLVRRNRAALTTLAIVATAVLLGLVGTSWQAIRASVAEREARENEQRALESAKEARAAARAELQQRRQAEASQRIASEEAAVAQAVRDFLNYDLLGLASADAQVEARLEPDPEITLATLVDRAITRIEDRFGDQPRVRAEIQSVLAGVLHRIGRFDQEVQMRQKVQEFHETTLGGDHPETLRSLHYLAHSFGSQGQWPREVELLERVLRGQEQVLGNDHPETAKTRNCLGRACVVSGDMERAVSLLDLAGEQSPEILSDNDAVAAKNQATLYRGQGELAAAERLLAQVLAWNIRKHGSEHPSTLTAINDLAICLLEQNKTDQAETYFRGLLETSRRVRGAGHPETLTVMHNLASLYSDLGRFREAESLWKETLESTSLAFGSDHPDTLKTMNNLGNFYLSQGRLAEAEPLLRQSLDMHRQALGDRHPQTLTAMHNLALMYLNKGEYAEAEPLALQVLELRRQVVGRDHPDTMRSRNNLAVLYLQQGKPGEAEPLLRETAEVMRQNLGAEHPDTVNAMFNLAGACADQERWHDVVTLMEEVVVAREHTPAGKAGAHDLSLLGKAFVRTERYSKAEPLLRRCLDILETHPDNYLQYRSQSLLGESLSGQGKFVEAESLLLQGYRGLANTWTQPDKVQKRRVAETVQALITHYQSTSRPAEVSRWQAELDRLTHRSD